MDAGAAEVFPVLSPALRWLCCPEVMWLSDLGCHPASCNKPFPRAVISAGVVVIDESTLARESFLGWVDLKLSPGFLKELKIELPFNPAIPFLGI